MEKLAAKIWSLVTGYRLLVICLLATSYLLLATLTPRPAFAETICPDDPNPGGEPNPQPCKYACYTDKLTDNYVTDEDGNAPINITIPIDDLVENQPVSVPVNENYVVDFSKLQGIFGATNSNYQEGNFQDEAHRKENIIELNSQDFNKYHGPGQKIATKTLTDDLKVKYVNYIWLNSHLPEASNTYTDINNNDKDDPKTIYRLVNMYDQPKPPAPGDDSTIWLETWGKYWEKIPTTYSEFYRGYIVFRFAMSEKKFLAIEENGDCPEDTGRTPIEFIMPEFKRTVSISDQLNQIVVPCAAQSWRHGDNVGTNSNPDDPDNCFRKYLASSSTQNRNASVLGKFIKACKDIINGVSKPLIKKLRSTIQTSFKFFNPVKVALAVDPVPTPSPPACIKILAEGKEGTAPFCALPEFSEFTQNGVPQHVPQDAQCLDKPTTNKLDNDGNPRVVCVFNIAFTKTFIPRSNIPDEVADRADTDFDHCVDDDNDGDLECTVKLRIWPVFRVPFLSEIWNNTLYSNEAEGEAGDGVGSPQLTGRPGIYSSFIPKAIYNVLFPRPGSELTDELIQECLQNSASQECQDFLSTPGVAFCALASEGHPDPFKFFQECTGRLLERNLPGQVASNVQGTNTNVLGTTPGDTKERFIGATDCAKVFTRDISLKPRALQKEQGLEEQKCNLEARALPEGPPGELGPPPPNVSPNTDDCSGRYDLTTNPNPLGNFGDPECDFSVTLLTEYLEQVDPTNVSKWLTIIAGESGSNPNAWLTGDPSAPYHSPDPAGAWGLFQMGRGKNGQYDHGDVVWQLQVYNAVSYNNYLISIGIPFCYWEVAINAGIAQGC